MRREVTDGALISHSEIKSTSAHARAGDPPGNVRVHRPGGADEPKAAIVDRGPGTGAVTGADGCPGRDRDPIASSHGGDAGTAREQTPPATRATRRRHEPRGSAGGRARRRARGDPQREPASAAPPTPPRDRPPPTPR